MALNGTGARFNFNEAVSFWVDCADQRELDYYWNALMAGGGAPMACGWLKDRFGVRWQIVPKKISEYIKTPGGMKAMMGMIKLDFAELEEASKSQYGGFCISVETTGIFETRMTYRIARNGQVVGAFSLPELRQEIAAGRVAPVDLARADGMAEWLSVSELFPGSPLVEGSDRVPRLFADPPDLRWWIALILGVLTLGVFFVVWDVVQAAWLRRVERSSTALILYCVALAVFVVNVPAQWAGINHALFNGPLVGTPFALWLSLGAIVTRLAARFVMRSDLMRHFMTAEPIGLELNAFLTLLLGGLYFQYHFNQINEAKRKLRISVPSE